MAFEVAADFASALRPSTSVSEPRQNPIGNTFLNWWTGEDIAPKMQARARSYSGYISHQQKIIAEDELPVGKCTANPAEEATSTRIGSKTVARKFEMILNLKAEGQEGFQNMRTDTPTTRCSSTWDDNEGSVVDDDYLGDNPTSTGEATTLMFRNLPKEIVQQDLIDALHGAGFAGHFDFCYMPSNFENGKGKGYAFINLINSEMAEALRSAWDGRNPFRMNKANKGRVRASLAHIQGRDANIRKWNTRKTMRIKNQNHRPFIPGASEVPA
jgi:hypothetical protein